MKVSNCNSGINFGWNGVTHEALTSAAANKINKDINGNINQSTFDVRTLVEASVLPDKEPHPNGSHCAIFSKLKDGDAFSVFKSYDQNIKEALEQKNTGDVDVLMGKALHYLQDMLNPMHAIYNPKGILSEKEATAHYNFEKDVVGVQHSIITTAKADFDKSCLSFPDFLSLKMQETEKSANEFVRSLSQRGNKLQKAIEFSRLKKLSLINSYQITYKYLEEISKYI